MDAARKVAAIVAMVVATAWFIHALDYAVDHDRSVFGTPEYRAAIQGWIEQGR